MILLYILASISITLLISGSSIFSPVRNWIFENQENFKYGDKFVELIRCNQCLGYWIGTFFFLFFGLIDSEINFSIIKSFIIYGPTISLLADLTYRLKNFLCKTCG